MITQTRPSETLKTEVKEERRLDWVLISQIALQTVFTISTLYFAHVAYIHVWRMITGH
jgi:hypothetical protein